MKKILLLSLVTCSMFAMEPSKPLTKKVLTNREKTTIALHALGIPLVTTLTMAPIVATPPFFFGAPLLIPVTVAAITWAAMDKLTERNPENNR
jgi:hypothetical protein